MPNQMSCSQLHDTPVHITCQSGCVTTHNTHFLFLFMSYSPSSFCFLILQGNYIRLLLMSSNSRGDISSRCLHVIQTIMKNIEKNQQDRLICNTSLHKHARFLHKLTSTCVTKNMTAYTIISYSLICFF